MPRTMEASCALRAFFSESHPTRRRMCDFFAQSRRIRADESAFRRNNYRVHWKSAQLDTLLSEYNGGVTNSTR